MAFPSGWTYKCPITIPYSIIAAKVSANVTNIPILLTLANLPSTILATCAADGSDIRFATDSAGTTQCPREIVKIVKTSGSEVLTIYVKLPTISYTANTVFYVFWGNSSAGEPGVGDPSLSTLTWSDYYGVFHFANVTSAWKGVKDSSGAYSNANTNGTITTAVGHATGTTCLSLTQSFILDLNEYFYFYRNGTVATTNDFMFWAHQGTAYVPGTAGTVALGKDGIKFGWFGNGQFGLDWGGCQNTSGSCGFGAWHHVWIRNTASVGRVYIDGVDRTSMTTVPTAAYNFATLGLNTTAGAVFKISEWRMTRGINTPVNTVLIQVLNESAPSSFCAAGTTVTTPVQYTLSLTGLKTGSEVRIFTAGTRTELTGIESTTSSTFSYQYSYTADFNVDIVIMNIGYQYIRYTSITCTSSNMSIPIQQQLDRTYYNP